MEPHGLLITTLIIGLLVFAMGVDSATSDPQRHPKESGVHGGKKKNSNNVRR